MAIYLLADNGSIRPNATLQLRHIAKQLSEQVGNTIYPVSFQHADKIPPDQLDDQPAQLFRDFMKQQLAKGEKKFYLIPLFFGKSRAITSFVPDIITQLSEQYPYFNLQVVDVIYPLPDGEPLLSEIIYQHIYQTAEQQNLSVKNVVLVDHGSPVAKVTAVRNHLAHSVQDKLTNTCILEQACMERRSGEEYDFNGSLLKDWLVEKAQSGEFSALVILMFFLPGKHAGAGGDIVEICDSVMALYPNFQISISPLITDHPLFLSILKNRIEQK